MITEENIDRILDSGGNVVDSMGKKIGSVGQIYLDDQTGKPSWVTANTGLFGTSESFVPLENANMDGNDIKVGYTKDEVKDAPRVEPDGNLSTDEEDRLYRHYGLDGSGVGTGDIGTGGVGATDGVDSVGTDRRDDTRSDAYNDEARADSYGAGQSGTVGRDTSGPTTDDAMTRSEERVNVGTQNVETGRARLRKHIVTENQSKTVPVSREEVRVEREPITDANRGDALDGPQLSEEEHEVTLHEERPVVEKETVPVERVRLDKETVADQETVNTEVRKEEIDTDTDDQNRKNR